MENKKETIENLLKLSLHAEMTVRGMTTRLQQIREAQAQIDDIKKQYDDQRVKNILEKNDFAICQTRQVCRRLYFGEALPKRFFKPYQALKDVRRNQAYSAFPLPHRRRLCQHPWYGQVGGQDVQGCI